MANWTRNTPRGPRPMGWEPGQAGVEDRGKDPEGAWSSDPNTSHSLWNVPILLPIPPLSLEWVWFFFFLIKNA